MSCLCLFVLIFLKGTDKFAFYLEIYKVRTKARIVEGDTGKVICREAERLKPAAVIVGTRGRSLIQRYSTKLCLYYRENSLFAIKNYSHSFLATERNKFLICH
jgi:hypothetical protein